MKPKQVSNSMTRTGRSQLAPGSYWLWLAADRAVARVKLSKVLPVRMGVHPSTRETVFHPIGADGKVNYYLTLFDPSFHPGKYGIPIKSLEGAKRK